MQPAGRLATVSDSAPFGGVLCRRRVVFRDRKVFVGHW